MCDTPNRFDTLLNLCRNVRRRIILGAFVGRTEPATLTDLEQVILEHDQHASSEQERTIRIALIHKHVPKLEAAALLEYDSDRRLVTPTSTFERWQPQISTILEADPTLETPIRF